jgi:uncharacterized protein with ATP-grasp and redox domains
MILVALFVCSIILSACANDTTHVSKEIEANLQTILTANSFGVSSNPNDYIRNNQTSYDAIISKGQPAFEYLTNVLKKSDQNGLNEWIMAKACSDILKDKDPVKEWATGKEWLQKYGKQN